MSEGMRLHPLFVDQPCASSDGPAARRPFLQYLRQCDCMHTQPAHPSSLWNLFGWIYGVQVLVQDRPLGMSKACHADLSAVTPYCQKTSVLFHDCNIVENMLVVFLRLVCQCGGKGAGSCKGWSYFFSSGSKLWNPS